MGDNTTVKKNTNPFGAAKKKNPAKKTLTNPFANVNIDSGNNDDEFEGLTFDQSNQGGAGQVPNKKSISNPFGGGNNDNQGFGFQEGGNPPTLGKNKSYESQQPTSSNPWGFEPDDGNNNQADLSGNINLGGGGQAKRANPTNPYANSNKNVISQPFANQQQGGNQQYGGQQQPQPNNPNFGGVQNSSFLRNIAGAGSFMSGVFSLFGGGQQQQYQQVPGQDNNGGQYQDPNQQYDEDDIENEPPLLEDLGIDLQLIKNRAIGVVRFTKIDRESVAEPDMSGALLLALVLGFLLLLKGKVTFGYIYGFGLMGTISIWFIINLLSQHAKAQLYNTMSILGYCLLPIVILATISVLLDLVNIFGFIITLALVFWATAAASNFFEVLLQLNHQKWLVGYPVFLFYLIFSMLTVF